MVVLTDASLHEQLRVNAWTRAAGRRLIAADVRGLFSFLFVDLGMQFRVDDRDGEQCNEIYAAISFHLQVLIWRIDTASRDVTTLEKALHGFKDGDRITFAKVEGMAELNGISPLLRIN
jgi:hypothetical protein